MLKNECEISPAWHPQMGGAQPPFVAFDAIWDTGATNSVVTQKVIDDCGLVATGVAQVHAVLGSAQSETFLVNIALPNKVVLTPVRVTKGSFVGGDILIGMDVINQGDFAVTNHNGITRFSFRMPSQRSIDFVDEINKARKAQGPNREARRKAKKASRRR